LRQTTGELLGLAPMLTAHEPPMLPGLAPRARPSSFAMIASESHLHGSWEVPPAAHAHRNHEPPYRRRQTARTLPIDKVSVTHVGGYDGSWGAHTLCNARIAVHEPAVALAQFEN